VIRSLVEAGMRSGSMKDLLLSSLHSVRSVSSRIHTWTSKNQFTIIYFPGLMVQSKYLRAGMLTGYLAEGLLTIKALIYSTCYAGNWEILLSSEQ